MIKWLLKYLPRPVVVIGIVVTSTIALIIGAFLIIRLGLFLIRTSNEYFGNDFTFWFAVCCVILFCSVIVNYDQFDKMIPKRKTKDELDND